MVSLLCFLGLPVTSFASVLLCDSPAHALHMFQLAQCCPCYYPSLVFLSACDSQCAGSLSLYFVRYPSCHMCAVPLVHTSFYPKHPRYAVRTVRRGSVRVPRTYCTPPEAAAPAAGGGRAAAAERRPARVRARASRCRGGLRWGACFGRRPWPSGVPASGEREIDRQGITQNGLLLLNIPYNALSVHHTVYLSID